MLRNAALSKTASVSSVQHNDHSKWGPQYATDGLKQYDFLNSFHSAFEQTPWFMITLDMPLTIQYVRVFNRRDGNGEWNWNSLAVNCFSISYRVSYTLFIAYLKSICCNKNTLIYIGLIVYFLIQTYCFLHLGERFHDVAFEVSIDGSLFKQRGFFKGPGMTDQVIEILFDYPTIGKYVRNKITQGTNNALHFVEFEIYTLE